MRTERENELERMQNRSGMEAERSGTEQAWKQNITGTGTEQERNKSENWNEMQ